MFLISSDCDFLVDDQLTYIADLGQSIPHSVITGGKLIDLFDPPDLGVKACPWPIWIDPRQ